MATMYPISFGLLRLVFPGADGLSGHVAWIVVERSSFFFAGLFLVWILIVGHGMLLFAAVALC